MTVVVAYVPDLMDRSRLSAAGLDVHFVTTPGDLAPASVERSADIVVVDLGRPGVLDAIRSAGIVGRIVGFGAHVEADLLDAARAAGAHDVLPRSRFFANLDTVLR